MFVSFKSYVRSISEVPLALGGFSSDLSDGNYTTHIDSNPQWTWTVTSGNTTDATIYSGEEVK